MKKKMIIDWNHFNTLPLIPTREGELGVLDVLNIEYNKRTKKFLCQEHDDTNPSAKVSGEHNEKYRCYVCGAWGRALDLLGSVYNLSPKEAAVYLDDFFPGGIEEREELFTAPFISKIQLQALGLKKNPLHSVSLGNKNTPEKYTLETSEAIGLLLDKIDGYFDRTMSYIQGIFKSFPDISAEDKSYMIAKSRKDIEWSMNLKERLREYDTLIAEHLSSMEFSENENTR